MSNTTATQVPAYTIEEAKDEAILMLLRKLRRVDQDGKLTEKIWDQLSDGVKDTLMWAENRADRQRSTDRLAGIKLCTRPFPDASGLDDEEE